MNISNGYSVRIFVPSGSPDGLRIIEKSNWAGIGFAFPRIPIAIREALGRPEMQKPGVYILWGEGEDEHRPPQAYVGMTDSLSKRLHQHTGDENREWARAVAFTSKDGYFNVAHARYVESRLVSLADSRRCDLKNSQSPNEPNLSESDIADSDSFLRDVLSCLPLVGVNFFDELHARDTSYEDADHPRTITGQQEMLWLRRRGADATGYMLGGSEFIVLAGSTAAKEETASIYSWLANHRADLINRGILIEDGDSYRLTQDTMFKTSSRASGVMLGASSNGRNDWENAAGQSLNQIESAALDG